MKKISRQFRSCIVLVALVMSLFAGLLPQPDPVLASNFGDEITVDADNVQGAIDSAIYGNMLEWGKDNMNRLWSEMVYDRGFENATPASEPLRIEDDFAASALSTNWTPTLIAGSNAGSYTIQNGVITLSGGIDSRWGLLSNPINNSSQSKVVVQAHVTSISGNNAVVDIYGGTGSGDFSRFVEFGIEGGVLKVWADGRSSWTGSSVSLPGTLRVTMEPYGYNGRNYNFYYNGNLVYTLEGYDKVPASGFRVFLYGWSTSVTSWDWFSVDSQAPTKLFDDFNGSSLSSQWETTRLEGDNDGTVSVANGVLAITGGSNSRYGVMSKQIPNSTQSTVIVQARLNSYSGSNAILNLYGGSGAGNFSNYVEFGIEKGVLKVWTGNGVWTGNNVSTPCTLKVILNSYGSNGRSYTFYYNDSEVYRIGESSTDAYAIPPRDFRIFLYGWGNSVTQWDWVSVDTIPLSYAFDDFTSGTLSDFWTPMLLGGTTNGSLNLSNGELSITGGSNSRYGVMSDFIVDSAMRATTNIEAYISKITGTNAIINVYGGTGAGDFTNYVEFGIQNNQLHVWAYNQSTWDGPSVQAPAKLKVVVTGYGAGGRDFYFYYNDQLVHTLLNYTGVPEKDLSVFLYGWSNSVTSWDWVRVRTDTGWYPDGYADYVTYETDSSSAYAGRYAQKINILNHSTGRQGICQNGLSVTSGQEYTVSMYLKQSGLSAANINVTLGPGEDLTATYIPWLTQTLSNITGSLEKYTFTFTPGVTSDNAKMCVSFAAAGTLWVDQVSMMPNNAVNGFRKDYVDAIKEIAPTLMKWPGGCLADWYNWLDGIGSRDERMPFYQGQWYPYMWYANDFGIDEFMALAEEVGAKPFVAVNWGSATTQDAANLVEYLNGSDGTTYGAERAANGHSMPYNVQFWGVGNETWGSWERGHAEARTFASSFSEFAQAMRNVDSSIVIFAEGSNGNSGDQEWNRTLLQIASDDMDNLAQHFYYPQYPSTYNGTVLYRSVAAAPLAVENRLHTTQKAVQDATNRNIGVGVLEWNTMFCDTPLMLEQAMGAAIATGGMLNTFQRNHQFVQAATFSALADFWDGGAIQVNNSGLFLTPSSQVLKLYSNHHGDYLLSTTTVSSTYDSVAMDTIPAINGVPFIDASATRSSDGNYVYLTVVNRDESNSHSVAIALDGAGLIESNADVWTVNGPNEWSQNSIDYPNLVTTTQTSITNASNSFSYEFEPHSVTLIALRVSTSAITSTTITGQVVDKSGKGIVGATVWLDNNSSTTSGDGGVYQFVNVTDGTHFITASANGYSLESLKNVRIETDSRTALPIILEKSETLEDDFDSSQISSQWTPVLLAGSSSGSLSLSNSNLVMTGGTNSRYGVLSGYVLDSHALETEVEVRLSSYTGSNALINIYGGTGAGDFSNFVEFGIESGVLKVFASGADWTGGAATTPATLKVVVSGYGASGRTFEFYYNGTLVHTLNNYTGVPDADFRLFLYGWSTSTTNWDWVSVRTNPSETVYDNFLGTALSNQWTPTLISGSTNGSVGLSGGTLTINGGDNSRYGVLSKTVSNSATNTSLIEAKIDAYSGSSVWLNIYGGTGAGDYSDFVEYGIDSGVLKVVTEDPNLNWTGDSVVTPALLKIVVSGYGSNGRKFDFYYNGDLVYTLNGYTGVPNVDYKLFLYGWSTGVIDWDWARIRVEPSETVYDDFPGSSLSNLWTPTILTGSNSGSISLSDGILTINGGNNSRYGILSNSITNSNTSIMGIETLITGYSGSNALMDIYGGTGTGDFSKYIEFGIENGHLQVYGEGIASWTGRTASFPAALKVVVGKYGTNGRDIWFFYNGDLVYTLYNCTVIPSTTYKLFLYGWNNSTTYWDWVSLEGD